MSDTQGKQAQPENLGGSDTAVSKHEEEEGEYLSDTVSDKYQEPDKPDDTPTPTFNNSLPGY